MQGALIARTVIVVVLGLVFAVIGLGVRERLWRSGPGDYGTELVVPKAAAEEQVADVGLRVRVLDSDSGAPVSGAAVWIDDLGGAPHRTDGDGWASLANVAPGAHSLQVSADGYAFAEREIEADGAAHAFRLQRGVALRGVVRDGKGAPVKGAQVEVRRLDWHGMLLQSVSTDADGAFSSEALQERGVELTATAGALHGRAFVQLPDEAVELRLSEGPMRALKLGASAKKFTPPFELPRRQGLRRSVRVLAPNGEPVPGARVYVLAKDGPPAMALFRAGDAELLGFTDPEGRVQVARGVGGCLIAGAWPYAPSAQQPCVDAEPEDEATLQLRAGAWVSGRAALGPGVLLVESPEGAAAVTGPDGGFRAGPLSAGAHSFEAWSADGLQLDAGFTVDLKEGEEASASL